MLRREGFIEDRKMLEGKYSLSYRPDLLKLIECGILTKDAAEEVIMQEKRLSDEKRRDELRAMFAAVHKSPITQSEKDGRWRTRVRKDDGKLHLIAKKDLDGIQRALNQHYFGTDNLAGINEIMTIRALYPIWLQEKRETKQVSSIISIEEKWRNYIEPYQEIVDVPIVSLTAAALKEWQLELLRGSNGRQPLKVKNYYNVRSIINGVLDKAVEKGIVNSNVSRYAKVDGMKSRELQQKLDVEDDEDLLGGIVVLDDDELGRIKKAAWRFARDPKQRNQLHFLALLFMAETGVRVGELLAIKLKDIRGGVLRAQRFYAYTEDYIDEENGEHVYVIKHWLKNYKIKRDIPLTEEALHIIEEAKMIKDTFGYDSEYLFSKDKNPVRYYPINNSMKKLCREAELPEHRMYVFRKTWISALVDSSMFTLSQIAEMAGNTPAVIMSSYYGRRQEIPNGMTLSVALQSRL